MNLAPYLFIQGSAVSQRFKRIKQRLRIKAVCGTSEHAVTLQIWIAVSARVQAAIIKKRFTLPASL